MEQKLINNKGKSAADFETGKPSEWYKAAKDTVIYRLSELIFGSLLASFVLGFVAFSGLSYDKTSGLTSFIFTTGIYLLISAIYTYFTVGLYLYYHTGILTMPSFPYKLKAKRDFMLSLLPAISFGLSMINPLLLLVTLGITIYIVQSVHIIEQNRLVDILYSKFIGSYAKPNSIKEDDLHKINKILTTGVKTSEIFSSRKISEEDEKIHKITGWLPGEKKVKIGASIITIGGLLLLYINFFNPTVIKFKYETYLLFNIKNNNCIFKPIDLFNFLITLITFTLVYIKVSKVFTLASDFLSDSSEGENSYDKIYAIIIDKIKGLK